MLLGAKPGWAQVGTFTAIFFAVGVGLPGGSTADAGERLVLSLLGGLWGFLGIGLRSYFASRRKSGVASSTKGTLVQTISKAASSANQSDAIKQAVTVRSSFCRRTGGWSVAGSSKRFLDSCHYCTGIATEHPCNNQPLINDCSGHAGGGLDRCIIAFEVLNDYLLWVFLLVFWVTFYATRGMNLRTVAGIHDTFHNRPSQHPLSGTLAARRSEDTRRSNRRSDSGVDCLNS